MARWHMEVGRMAFYLAFPICLFHLFNQPEYFEDWVTKKKHEIYPRSDPVGEEKFKNLVATMKKKEYDAKFAGME